MRIYQSPFRNTHFDVPVYPHPGAFKAKRTHEIHTGVDLYVEDGTAVFPIEEGKIVNIVAFTGEHAELPWWENTWAVLVSGRTGTIVYGEIKPNPDLKIGDKVTFRTMLGEVIPVIKNVKESTISRSMLHVELMNHDRTREAPMVGRTGHREDPFPHWVQDPTNLLIQVRNE